MLIDKLNLISEANETGQDLEPEETCSEICHGLCENMYSYCGLLTNMISQSRCRKKRQTKNALKIIFAIISCILVLYIIRGIFTFDKTPQIALVEIKKVNINRFAGYCLSLQDCNLKVERRVLIAIVLTSLLTLKEEVEVLHDILTTSGFHNNDIIYFLGEKSLINKQIMINYYVTEKVSMDFVLATLSDKNLGYDGNFQWLLVIYNINVYIDHAKLIHYLDELNPNQVLYVGIAAENSRYCNRNYGVIYSEGLLFLLQDCIRQNRGKNQIEDFYMYCIDEIDITCEIPHQDDNNPLYYVEPVNWIDALSNTYSNLEESTVIYPFFEESSLLYSIKNAKLQTQYHRELDELKLATDNANQMEFDILKSAEKPTQIQFGYNENINSKQDVWIFMQGSKLYSTENNKLEDIGQDGISSLNQLVDNIWENYKKGLNMAEYTFIQLRDVIINHQPNLRRYFITLIVENKFPDYIFIEMYIEKTFETHGSLKYIVPISISTSKISIVLFLNGSDKDKIKLFKKNIKSNSEIIFVQTGANNSNSANYSSLITQDDFIKTIKDLRNDEFIFVLTNSLLLNINDDVINKCKRLTKKGLRAYISSKISLISVHIHDLDRILGEKGLQTCEKFGGSLITCIESLLTSNREITVLVLPD